MKTQLLNIGITTLPYQQMLSRLIEKAYQGSSYACMANVHMLVEAHRNPSYASILNNADFVTADGKPLGRGLKLLYGITQERVSGMDLLPDLLKKSEEYGIPVFFYGSTEDVLAKTKKHIVQRYPSLPVVGLYSPPFRPLTQMEEISVVNQINESGARFVFVALGCPKQERWMANMKGIINACMIGIGGALPVMIGIQRRAPKWVQDAYLEWLFRLIQEPRRLFKRYAVTNTIFIYLLFSEWAKQGFKKKQLINAYNNNNKVIDKNFVKASDN